MSNSLEIEALASTSFGEYTSTQTAIQTILNRSPRRVSTNAPDDQVTLSTTAKEQLWEQEGLTVSEIANQLGLTVSAVQADLEMATARSQTSAAAA